MQRILLPVFKFRLQCFAETSGQKFYDENENIIKRTSLAAQEYYFSGEFSKRPNGVLAHKIPEYLNIYKMYDLTFDSVLGDVPNHVNINNVMDLAMALDTDIKNGVLYLNGKIIHPFALFSSAVLKVPHIKYCDMKNTHVSEAMENMKFAHNR